MIKDFAYLQDRCKLWLDNNPLQTDADFSTDTIKKILNEAYEFEVNKAKTEASQYYFYQNYNFTWPASQTTYSIEGTPMEYMDQHNFQDVTSGEDKGYNINVYWRDRNTLYWGNSNGPSSARTIRCVYLARAEWLNADGDEPTLVIPAHRDLLALSAACLLRKIADEQAPGSWLQELDERRRAWWKDMADRPAGSTAQVRSLPSLTTPDDVGRSAPVGYAVPGNNNI